MPGAVVGVLVSEGELVSAGRTLVVLEVMKMEHPVTAAASGTVTGVLVAPGVAVAAGELLLTIAERDVASDEPDADAVIDLDGDPRADLAEVLARRLFLADDSPARVERVAARHERGHRTVRENIDALCDDSSFEEWGGFAVAAQQARRDMSELIERTPADGMVAGIGRVGGRPVAVAGIDYLVLAGTQGTRNHMKKDRLFEIVERLCLPVVLFAEGGGGRPGDTDMPPNKGEMGVGQKFALLSALGVNWDRLPGLVARDYMARDYTEDAASVAAEAMVVAMRGMARPQDYSKGQLASFLRQKMRWALGMELRRLARQIETVEMNEETLRVAV